jgi:hypothetical protein
MPDIRPIIKDGKVLIDSEKYNWNANKYEKILSEKFIPNIFIVNDSGTVL